jgi:hypothetical protein
VISPNNECDPLQAFVESIQDADFNYFLPDSITFFQDTFGIDLTKTKKEDLQQKLEEFFAKSEKDWTALYQNFSEKN